MAPGVHGKIEGPPLWIWRVIQHWDYQTTMTTAYTLGGERERGSRGIDGGTIRKVGRGGERGRALAGALW